MFNDQVTVLNKAVSGRSIQTWLYESNVTRTKNSAGECVVSPNPKGAVDAFFCNDHTHFEAAGADQIARAVAKALRDQKIDLASYLM